MTKNILIPEHEGHLSSAKTVMEFACEVMIYAFHADTPVARMKYAFEHIVNLANNGHNQLAIKLGGKFHVGIFEPEGLLVNPGDRTIYLGEPLDINELFIRLDEACCDHAVLMNVRTQMWQNIHTDYAQGIARFLIETDVFLYCAEIVAASTQNAKEEMR